MNARADLENTAEKWITLWCAPVDWTLFDEIHDKQFEDYSPSGRPPNKAGFAQGLADLIKAFPDLETWVEGLVIDELRSQAAVRWKAKGTNMEKFLGTGPTGRLTTITGIEIIEMSKGKIVRRWGEWDISDHAEGND